MKKSITIRQQHDKTVNVCRQCTVLGISLQICVHHCNPWREDCYLMDRCFLGVISLMVYLSRPKPFPFCVKKHLSEVRVGGFPSGFMCVCLWHFCNVGRLGLTERRNINYRTENLLRMYKPCDNYVWNPLSACISGQETEGSRYYRRDRGDSWDL